MKLKLTHTRCRVLAALLSSLSRATNWTQIHAARSTQRGMRAMTGNETRISFQWPPQLHSILLLPNAAFLTTAHDSRADTLDVIAVSLTVVPCALRRNHNNYSIYSQPLHWNDDKGHTYKFIQAQQTLTHASHSHIHTHASARIVIHTSRLDQIDVRRRKKKTERISVKTKTSGQRSTISF